MLLFIIINLIVAISLIVSHSFFLKTSQLLLMQTILFCCTFIDYMMIDSHHFINKLFITMMAVLFIIFFSVRKKLKYHSISYLLPALPAVVLIPVLLMTSDQSTYISTAYLSISIFIIGIILFVLGIIDLSEEFNQYNIYSYVKSPIIIGLSLSFFPIILMTLFMPYFYLYILWYILIIIYIKLAVNNKFSKKIV